MVEAMIPRVEGVGRQWNRRHEVRKGSVIKKAKSPRIPRVIQALSETAELSYFPLADLPARDIDPSTLPHVTMEAMAKILSDAALEKNSLANARKKKTSIPTSPVNKAAYRPIKKMGSPHEQRKQVEIRKLNDIIRSVLGGVWTYEQLSLLMFGSGHIVTEPRFAPEAPIRPLRPSKLNAVGKGEAKIIRRLHRKNKLAQKGRVYTY